MGLLLFSSNVGFAAAQQPSGIPPSDDVIRVDVNRVNVGVTVTDSRGRFIKGLRREDFEVFDNGHEQPILSFASSDEPARLVFLIESGIENYFLAKFGKSPFAVANDLLSAISPSGRVAIVTYSNRPQLALDFTSDKIEAGVALKSLHSRLLTTRAGSTSLNLSASILATLHWLALVPGTKTLVLFSTGMDTSPSGAWRIIQEKLRMSEVRILAVSLFGELRKFPKGAKLSRDERENRAFVKQGIANADQWLYHLSAASGGRAYVPKDAEDFRRAYAEIAQIVRGEYTLEFVPASLDGQLHSIRVKVKRRGYRIHHRQAYLALPSTPK